MPSAVSLRIADMEQKTRQHARESFGGSQLFQRAVVEDRMAVERCSSALDAVRVVAQRCIGGSPSGQHIPQCPVFKSHGD